ncbi:MAG TPA: hypothetical protein VKV27_06170 [Solirubrobacteraceae bacterium]|nr:hypothetical protein [Solirubrobacteraceae bacterium]
MTEHRSCRTLVKSAPELWAECSDPASLARHLGGLGEIRITRLEPETTVAWEGTAACGTVELAPAGWGTRVTMTIRPLTGADRGGAGAAVAGVDGAAAAVAGLDDGAAAVAGLDDAAEVVAATGRCAPAVPAPECSRPAVRAPDRAGAGAIARLLARLRGPRAAGAPGPAEAPAEAVGAGGPAPGPSAATMPDERVLAAALDSLGRAHHRPFSRA